MTKLISWVEIPTNDFERAVRFYNSVLKTDFQVIDCGHEKMACFPNGEGAISYAPGFNPSKDGALVSFNVERDLEGTIVQPKTKIEAEDRGYFALFIDCEGNKVGLYGDE